MTGGLRTQKVQQGVGKGVGPGERMGCCRLRTGRKGAGEWATDQVLIRVGDNAAAAAAMPVEIGGASLLYRALCPVSPQD